MSCPTGCRCRPCVLAMSPRDLFMGIVDDALRYMVFTSCWEHYVLVDIEDESRFTDVKQLALRRIVMRKMLLKRTRGACPTKQRMTMFELITCCIEAAMDMFGGATMPQEVPQLVGAFMWTAIDGRQPWTGVASVKPWDVMNADL